MWWSYLRSFTDMFFSCLSAFWSTVTNDPLLYTIFAILILDLAARILKAVKNDGGEE